MNRRFYNSVWLILLTGCLLRIQIAKPQPGDDLDGSAIMEMGFIHSYRELIAIIGNLYLHRYNMSFYVIIGGLW